MKLDVITEIWNMTKDSIMPTDRDTIAENLVGILIDNDYSPTEIRSAFREDYDVMSALKVYVEDAVEFEEDEESEYEEYDDSDDDNYNDDWE
jgi:hypothetical protein